MHFNSGLAFAALCSAALPASASEARTVADVALVAGAPVEASTVDIELSARAEPVWSGSLRIASPHGSASYSQSKSEFGGNCPGQPAMGNTRVNENLRLYLNRRNSKQQPNLFSVNVTWTRAVDPCEGGGNNTIGFERPVELPPGGAATIDGPGDLSVRLTRRR